MYLIDDNISVIARSGATKQSIKRDKFYGKMDCFARILRGSQ